MWCFAWYSKTIVFTLLIVLSIGASTAEQSPDVPNFIPVSQGDLESMDGVFAIAQDKQGYMWFGGKNGLRRYDGYKVTVFRHDATDPRSLSSNDVSDILVDREGRLWVALLSGGGLNRFDYDTQSFVKYQKNTRDAHSIGSMDIYAIEQDKHGDLWLATHDNGLNRLVHSTGHFHRYPIALPGTSDGSVRDITIDRLGNVWAATNNQGLYKINNNNYEFTHYEHSPSNPESLSDNRLFKVFSDSQNQIWVGTQNGVVERFEQSRGVFVHYGNDIDSRQGRDITKLSLDIIWDIAEDAKGVLWVASANGSLKRYNPRLDAFENIIEENDYAQTVPYKIIKMYKDRTDNFWLGSHYSQVSIVSEQSSQFKKIHHQRRNTSHGGRAVNNIDQDSMGNVWLATNTGLKKINENGTQIDGVGDESITIDSMAVDSKDKVWLFAESHLQRYSPTDKKYTLISDEYSLKEKINYVKNIFIDSDDGVWVATQGQGLFYFDQNLKQYKKYQYKRDEQSSLSHDYVWTVMEDSQKRIWVGTLVGFNLLDKNKKQFLRFTYESTNGALCDDSIRSIAEDRQGNIWLATNNCLSMYDPKENTFLNHGVKDGMADDSITATFADEKGNVWAATQKGLTRYNQKMRTYKNYDSRHGVAANAFPKKTSVLKKRNGEILVAGVFGITSVNLSDFKENATIPPVVLTDLYVNGEKQNQNSITHIGRIKTLNLSYEQRNFALAFASLNYIFPEQNKFQYKLIGFDQQWLMTDSTQRRATYSNLESGEYTFLVKGSNNEGLWNETPVQLKISIASPWWFSNVAIISYLAAFLFFWFLLWHFRRKAIPNEQVLEKRAIELDKVKQQFMSNAMGELSPSVNTIIGLSENILCGGAGEVSEKARQHVVMIYENSQKLSSLAQDMSAYADESSGDTLNVRALHLEPILEGVTNWFQRQAEGQSLKLYLSIEGDLQQVRADYSSIQKVLFNIIDNALKHTLHGYVEVTAKQQDRKVIIHIADTGVGISSDKQKQMFSEALPHGGGVNDNMQYITLARSKTLIEKQNGNLYLESTSDKGSIFVLALPTDTEQ